MKISAKLCISLRACCFSLLLIILNLSATAQVMSTSIRGLVRDTAGAVIPNATVTLTDSSTGTGYTTTSSSTGSFLFTGLQAGKYKLTIAATGFQTTTNPSIEVYGGRTTDLSMELAVSGASETVQISSGSDQLKTTSNEIGTTINNKVIMSLPYSSRDGLSFALLMPGNASANDPSGRQSTFNGLPNASMNITLDGMNNNSQRFKSGGTSFFSFAPARIDALEEVSVLTAGLGSDAGGQGAMNIRLTTKRGTEQYHGKVLHQFANEAMNANTYFNKLRGQARSKTRLNHAVGSIGGPLLPFVSKLKDKVFFFAYYEAVPQPTSFNATTTVLTPEVAQGNFSYLDTNGVTRTVNLLSAVGGTIDPTIKGMLSSINETRSKASSILPTGDSLNQQTLTWNQSRDFMTAYPTARIDYVINPSMAWHTTWNLRHQNNPGYPLHPGSKYDFPRAYKITTYVATNTFDWNIKPNMTNSFSFGIQSNGEYFYKGADLKQYSAQGNRILNIPFSGVPNIIPDANWQPFIRNNPVYQFTDNLNWLKGRHTITMGGTFMHTSYYERFYNSGGVPSYNFGIATNDPLDQKISDALPDFDPDANSLDDAKNLYALLTGRVSQISLNTNVDENTKKYAPLASVTQRFAFSTFGVYAQDSFRFRPSLTINYGLRWQLDGAIHSTNEINYTASGANFYGPSKGSFQPGVFSGNANPQFTTVSNPYKRDFINPAPNVGFAWNPESKNGWLGKILGERKTSIRGSYAITFFNEGLNSIANPMQNGPGSYQSGSAVNGVDWTVGTMNLSSPVPTINAFPAKFGEPIAQSSFAFQPQDGYNINPNLRSPYVQNWTISIQRELDKNTVLEIRYVGNKSTNLWHQQNMQETNIFENGFLAQFKQAQKNLAINQANGKGDTFAYNPSNPLPGQAATPIFNAAFRGLLSEQGYGSTTFVNNLKQGVAGTMASTLATESGYYCRLVGSNFAPCAALTDEANDYSTPGNYPINFFNANPYLQNLWYQNSDAKSNYNALQIDLNRRYSQGLVLGANYTWSHALGNLHNRDDQEAYYQWFTTRDSKLNYMSTPFDRRHVFNLFFVYELPFGKGKTFSVGNGILDRVIGGWSLGSRNTFASGNPFLLDGGRYTVNNHSQSGVTFGEDFSSEKLQKALSKVTGYFKANKAMISDISSIANVTTSTSRVKSNLYSGSSTPGEFAWFAQLRNNNYYQLDLNLTKDIRFTERWKLSLRADAFNFLNHPFFAIGNSNPNSSAFGQVTSARGERTMQIRASLEW